MSPMARGRRTLLELDIAYRLTVSILLAADLYGDWIYRSIDPSIDLCPCERNGDVTECAET